MFWRALIFAIAVVISAPSCLLAAEGDSSRMMSFELEPDTDIDRSLRVAFGGGLHIIYATGPIDNEADVRLRKIVVDEEIVHARILFNSPGGSLSGGMKLGEAIRELGFDTEIQSIGWKYDQSANAICASACSYAFAGGVNRYFSSKAGRLGLHQFSSATDESVDVGTVQVVSGILVRYLTRMGVDADAFALASLTDKREMTWLSEEQAIKFGLVNNGVQPTVAEIKLNGGSPYLKLEQQYDNVTSRVLLLCDKDGFEIMAGIVTTPELSFEKMQQSEKSYIEFDLTEFAPMRSPSGLVVNGSVLWVERALSPKALSMLQSNASIGMWTENGGAMRWGAFLDLKPVRAKIVDFIRNCR